MTQIWLFVGKRFWTGWLSFQDLKDVSEEQMFETPEWRSFNVQARIQDFEMGGEFL